MIETQIALCSISRSTDLPYRTFFLSFTNRGALSTDRSLYVSRATIRPSCNVCLPLCPPLLLRAFCYSLSAPLSVNCTCPFVCMRVFAVCCLQRCRRIFLPRQNAGPRIRGNLRLRPAYSVSRSACSCGPPLAGRGGLLVGSGGVGGRGSIVSFKCW